MKLLDTNVVIYALGRPHPYKEACAHLLREIGEGASGYIVDTEMLQEILYVYTRRAERWEAFRVFDNLLRLFPDPIPIDRGGIVEARRLLDRHPGLSPRDAIHAAVVQTQGLEGIVTTDRIFSEVHGLTTFDPRDLVADV